MSVFYVIQDHPLHIPRGRRLAFPSRTAQHPMLTARGGHRPGTRALTPPDLPSAVAVLLVTLEGELVSIQSPYNLHAIPHLTFPATIVASSLTLTGFRVGDSQAQEALSTGDRRLDCSVSKNRGKPTPLILQEAAMGLFDLWFLDWAT